MIVGIPQSLQENVNTMQSVGSMLAADSSRLLYEDERKGIKITMGDLLEDFEGSDWQRYGLAVLLENTRSFFESMDETTRLVNIGDFQKYAFNMVRALFPSIAAHNFASVQPMHGPVSLVFYMKFIYNLTKGSAVAGSDVIENPNEDYSSEYIDVEQLDVGDGATAQYTGNMTFVPVKPGTVQLTSVVAAAGVTVTDDGNGNLVGDVGAGSTIDYSTGAYDVTFSGNVDLGEAVNATYEYDMEANEVIPELDLTLTSAPVTALPRKLRTRWSVEAQQDLKNLHGMEAEIEQVAGITSELKFEIDREVVRDIKNIAQNSVTAFSRTPPTNISFTEHKLLFVDKLNEASNEIFDSTQRAVGTWVNAGIQVCNVIESLPGFVSMGKPQNSRGIYKTGRLNGQWDIWKDPTYPGATRNTPNPLGYLMGYKGENMWEVGYIFAPYIMAYTTPTVMLDDFIGRKGIASRYGKKAIDGRFFATGSVSGDPYA